MTKKKTNKKEETIKEVEEAQVAKEVEQSVWTVKINSQLLYKKAVDGRTILLGMTTEESEGVKEVMDKAIDELSEVLKEKTTQHEALPVKEPVTRFDAAKSDISEDVETDDVTEADTVDEFKMGGSTDSDDDEEEEQEVDAETEE